MTNTRSRANTFTKVNEAFLPENRSQWTNYGDRVRGKFDLLKMEGDNYGNGYSEHQAHDEVAKVPGRRMATAYEVEAYATDGWNQDDLVIGFGSWVGNDPGHRSFPVLFASGSERELELEEEGTEGWNISGFKTGWDADYYVLCVCE